MTSHDEKNTVMILFETFFAKPLCILVWLSAVSNKKGLHTKFKCYLIVNTVGGIWS